jgi:hypothetical protein
MGKELPSIKLQTDNCTRLINDDDNDDVGVMGCSPGLTFCCNFKCINSLDLIHDTRQKPVIVEDTNIYDAIFAHSCGDPAGDHS